MATLILSTVGNAILPGAGGFIGALAGSFIDQAIFAPDTHPQKLDDMPLNSGTEGTPVNYFISKENRVNGEVMWLGPKIVTAHHQSGKGGGGIANYTRSQSLAICWGKSPLGPVNRVVKIYADGKLFYDLNTSVNVSSNLLSAVKSDYYVLEQGDDPGFPTLHSYLNILSPVGGPDLSQFHGGLNVTVSGWVGGATPNNGTFFCVAAVKNTDGTSAIKLKNDAAVNAAAGSIIVLAQTLPVFPPGKAASITNYLGTAVQTPNALIEAYQGTGNVPAHTGKVYTVIELLELEEFGNRMPQFQAVVEESATNRTLAQAITAVMTFGGRPATDYDVTAVTGSVRGYSWRGPQSPAEILTPLLLAYGVTAKESGGKLVFSMRATPPVKVVDPIDLAAHPYGADSPRAVRINDMTSRQIPVEVDVSYVDPASDYQTGSQRQRRARSISDNIVTVSLPFVFSASAARDLAKSLLWTAAANRQPVTLKLPPSYVDVEEGDLLTFTAHGVPWIIRARKVDEGSNYLLEVEGATEEVDTLTYTGSSAEDPIDPHNQIFVAPTMFLWMMDLAPLIDAHLTIGGTYYAACLEDPTPPYPGAELLESTDGTNYDSVQVIAAESTMGRSVGILGVGQPGYWDVANTVTVTLNEGTLENKTDAEVLTGSNRALLGSEVIAYGVATLVATRQYTLSRLLRGLRNTESAIAIHTASEVFVSLNDTGVGFRQLSADALNSSRGYKAVAALADPADSDAQFLSVKLNTLRPFSVAHVKGNRNASNDLTITWDRRSRANIAALQGQLAPLLEEFEHYELDIMNVAETVVLNTLFVTDATTVTYSAAQQTTDTLTPGNAVHVWIYQMSATIGRGRVEKAVI